MRIRCPRAGWGTRGPRPQSQTTTTVPGRRASMCACLHTLDRYGYTRASTQAHKHPRTRAYAEGALPGWARATCNAIRGTDPPRFWLRSYIYTRIYIYGDVYISVYLPTCLPRQTFEASGNIAWLLLSTPNAAHLFPSKAIQSPLDNAANDKRQTTSTRIDTYD